MTDRMTAGKRGADDPLDSMSDDMLDAYLQALVRDSQTPPSTLSGAEQPSPPLELQPQPAPMPGAWQGLPDRPTREMIARPLMPQSAGEARDQAEANQSLATAYSTGLMAAALHPAGRAIDAAAMLGRAAITRFPLLAGAAAITAAPGEATPPDPVQALAAHQDKIKEDEAEQKRLRDVGRTLQASLADFRQRFGSVNRGSPQAQIRALQQFLSSADGGSTYRQTIDGVWSGGTQAAIDAFLKKNTDDTNTNTANLGTVDARLRLLNSQLQSMQGDARIARFQSEAPWWRRALSGWQGQVGGFLFGNGIGYAGRRLVARYANNTRAAEMAAADARIVPEGTLNERFSGANLFFNRGGGPEPFRPSTRAEFGFTPAPGEATRYSGADLYPPPITPYNFRGQLRGYDLLSGATMGLANATGMWRMDYVQHRYDQALAEFNRDPSDHNSQELVSAEIELGLTRAGLRAAQGTPVGYLAGARSGRYVYGRPDLQRAMTERSDLNDILAGRAVAPPVPIPVGGTFTPRGTITPGSVFSTPGRRRSKTLGPNGWVDENGAPTSPPRRDWIRRSEAQTGADLAVG